MHFAKSGDLCAVVRTSSGNTHIPVELLGEMVTVTEAHSTRYGVMWMIKEPILWTAPTDCLDPHGNDIAAGTVCWVCALPEAVLQRIRGLPVATTTECEVAA
jgi:hypothetical protein